MTFDTSRHDSSNEGRLSSADSSNEGKLSSTGTPSPAEATVRGRVGEGEYPAGTAPTYNTPRITIQ